MDGTRTISRLPRLPTAAQLMKWGRRWGSIPTKGNTAAPRIMPSTMFRRLLAGTGHHDLNVAKETSACRKLQAARAGRKTLNASLEIRARLSLVRTPCGRLQMFDNRKGAADNPARTKLAWNLFRRQVCIPGGSLGWQSAW